MLKKNQRQIYRDWWLKILMVCMPPPNMSSVIVSMSHLHAMLKLLLYIDFQNPKICNEAKDNFYCYFFRKKVKIKILQIVIETHPTNSYTDSELIMEINLQKL